MAVVEFLRGMLTVAKHALKKPVTYQYPETQKPYAPRYHGRHQLNRYEDGLEKCIGCELCAWACPADAIFVQGANNTVELRYSPGERYASDYQINYLRCIFCGLCIEACPTRALTMTGEDFVADVTRENLIYTKERLLAPLPASAKQAPPFTDAQIAARGIDYYGGYAKTPDLTSADGAGRAAAAERGGEPKAGA